MDVIEDKWMMKVENILLMQVLLSFKNNLKLDIIRALQTKYWHLENIDPEAIKDSRMLELEETLRSSLHFWKLRPTEVKEILSANSWVETMPGLKLGSLKSLS